MNTDRELLELAAKAAGIENQGYCSDGYLFVGNGESGAYDRWNPLTDDGDALRLAVMLQLEIVPDERRNLVWVESIVLMEPYANDPYAATRRAIVRAAARIGEMK